MDDEGNREKVKKAWELIEGDAKQQMRENPVNL